MRGHTVHVSGACGVNTFVNFQYTWASINESVRLGGADLACTGFINTKLCQEAYEELKKKFKIVYQSSVRLNRNSENQFFFVVYDKKD